MFVKKLSLLIIMAALSLLTACSTFNGDEQTNASVEDRTGDGTTGNASGDGSYEGQTGTYSHSDMNNGTAVNGDPLSDADSALSIRTIYFNYDSTEITTEGQSALNAHAEFLSLNPSLKIILEGHTDERGTREYNLSLGERRGQAIADFLIASGVPAQQLEVRSYGEENPVALDHSEAAWQLNRRVELLY